MKEILTILILITATHHVDNTVSAGADETAGGAPIGTTQILFGGKADGPYFKGEVLPGGVDTQTHWTKDSTTLSARYMLRGVDADGKECTIYVQNEGTFCPQCGPETRPSIITDSECLRRAMGNKPLTGKLDFGGGKLTIRVFAEE